MHQRRCSTASMTCATTQRRNATWRSDNAPWSRRGMQKTPYLQLSPSAAAAAGTPGRGSRSPPAPPAPPRFRFLPRDRQSEMKTTRFVCTRLLLQRRPCSAVRLVWSGRSSDVLEALCRVQRHALRQREKLWRTTSVHSMTPEARGVRTRLCRKTPSVSGVKVSFVVTRHPTLRRVESVAH